MDRVDGVCMEEAIVTMEGSYGNYGRGCGGLGGGYCGYGNYGGGVFWDIEAITQISMVVKSLQELPLRKGIINKYNIIYNIINLHIPINFFENTIIP